MAEVRILGSNDPARVIPQLADVDILSGSWGMPTLSDEVLAAAPRLRAVCYAAGSVKGFATPAAFARGVIITTAMHANAIPVAEVSVALPDGATFINTARGRLVDEVALLAELKAGRISAHLDVTWPEPPAENSELYRLPNCWLTPHRAGSSSREIQRMGRYAIDECLAILGGREPRYRVLESMLATMA